MHNFDHGVGDLPIATGGPGRSRGVWTGVLSYLFDFMGDFVGDGGDDPSEEKEGCSYGEDEDNGGGIHGREAAREARRRARVQ